MGSVSRRGFLGAAVGTAAGVGRSSPPHALPGPLCFFSKHLPGLDAKGLGRALKPLGFTGIDLTVRPGGHVSPERAASDFPSFVTTLRGEGLAVPVITTGLTSASDPTARPILETAGRLEVPLFKPGYYR